jgi:hypothetical protein
MLSFKDELPGVALVTRLQFASPVLFGASRYSSRVADGLVPVRRLPASITTAVDDDRFPTAILVAEAQSIEVPPDGIEVRASA